MAEELPPNLPPHVYLGFARRFRLAAVPKVPIVVPVNRGHNYCSPHSCSSMRGHSLAHSYQVVEYDELGFETDRTWWRAVECGIPFPDFIRPYSVRSYLLQLSQSEVVEGCHYAVFDAGSNKYGTRYIHDVCYPFSATTTFRECPFGELEHAYPCGFAKGWPDGTPEKGKCPTWDFHSDVLMKDSEYERTFFYHYLKQNRDREAPMLIPQVWTDDIERHRADFMIFVEGEHYWRRIVVEIYSAGHAQRDQMVKDAARKRKTALLGYEFVEFWAEELKANALECVRELREFISIKR